MAIKLTEVERRILANQELILAKLYPEEEWHINNAKVYEYWFSTEYEEVLNIDKDDSHEDYEETVNILNMFSGIYNIKHTIEKEGLLENISMYDLSMIKYEWFDHNHDSHYWYAQFLINDKRHFQNLKNDNGVWVWVLPRYRRLLKAWNNLISTNRWDFWKEDIVYLIQHAKNEIT